MVGKCGNRQNGNHGSKDHILDLQAESREKEARERAGKLEIEHDFRKHQLGIKY